MLEVLKQRIISASVLIPIIFIGVYSLSTDWFAVLLAVFISVGAWEWAAMCGYKTSMSRLLYALFIIGVLLLIYLFRETPISLIIVVMALIWWFLAMLLLIFFPQYINAVLDSSYLRKSIGFLVLVPAWLSLVLLHANGSKGVILLLFLLVLIWVADSAAYFIGRRWGKTKLSRTVSPSKTWEGVFGALFATFILGMFYAFFNNMHGIQLVIFLSICQLTVLVSVLGDLLESMIKRQSRLKDSGSIIPGHGGVMDRIDGLTAAGPFFLASLWLFKELP